MGQVWAAARDKVWRLRDDPYGRQVYALKLVYCHTDQMQYRSAEYPDGECIKYGGVPSFSRCSRCRSNYGVTHITSHSMPDTVGRVRLI